MAALEFTGSWLSRVVPSSLIGQVKARDCREMLGVLWENRKEIPYAWNVLKHGVCDGCSLGPHGLRDNGLDGVHFCMSRLKLLKLNTMSALDMSALSDVERLRAMRPDQLRALGRLSHPMVRRKAGRGFLRISWDDALDIVSRSIHGITPHEMVFCATSRGLTNEVYYVFQKLARALGTNNIDLCSRDDPGASVSGLKATLGYGAATCSLSDFIGADLLVIFGADLADNRPVTAKYLRCAKNAKTRIVAIDSMRESKPELTDDFFSVGIRGLAAFIDGVLKTLIVNEQVDPEFIAKQTAGFGELKAALDRQSWTTLEQRSGVARGEMQRFALLYSQARTAVIVYDGTLARHNLGAGNVKAVVNLALARGMIGREKCGIMPIRGRSGVQGGGDCGCEPDKFPGGFPVNDGTSRRFSNLWHHPVPASSGLKAADMIEAARKGEIKLLYSLGGNLLKAGPEPKSVAEALGRVPFRVHQDIVLNPSMLVDAADAVVLLPGQTRYEQKGGGTSTSTERRIRFSPEIPGHGIGETRPDWEIPQLIGRKAMPNGDRLFPFQNTQAIREEMSRVMPIYQGVEKLTKEGDQLQWGGPQLYRDGFTQMSNHRALFTAFDLTQPPPDSDNQP